MHIPGYTISLLFWILPVCGIMFFLINRKLLSPEKWFALFATIAILSSVGITLDLLYAHRFFIFNNPESICGILINKIPVEEFVFYITGFWFILFVYVFCDEWFLSKYNVPDEDYARYRAVLKFKFVLHLKSLWIVPVLIVIGTLLKRMINPGGDFIPGYFSFLVIVAYVPAFLFFNVTRYFVNWRSFLFSMMLTIIISITWEVTLAIPNGYWLYNKGAMLGIFIKTWHDLPIEAVTVWVFSTLIILVYEFLKICYFTPQPSVPGYRILLKMGKESKHI